jgi:ribosome-binding factor A
MSHGSETPRTRRVADRIAQVLAEVLERRTEDPRLRTITVTGARVSRDLGVARVWVTGGFAAADEPNVLAALRHATPRFRSLLAPELGLRAVPNLTFVIDRSAETGARIVALLHDLEQERRAAPEPAPDGGDVAGGAPDAGDAAPPESQED